MSKRLSPMHECREACVSAALARLRTVAHLATLVTEALPALGAFAQASLAFSIPISRRPHRTDDERQAA
ncbi:hypothetical protein AYO40_01985 [Planctomycetaceae bacterium SCGC AG-212-D15]|nr:hypothetical protein AYO40_01985 [Planctomycetaceae bacterium SCGC AG-212-D15]